MFPCRPPRSPPRPGVAGGLGVTCVRSHFLCPHGLWVSPHGPRPAGAPTQPGPWGHREPCPAGVVRWSPGGLCFVPSFLTRPQSRRPGGVVRAALGCPCPEPPSTSCTASRQRVPQPAGSVSCVGPGPATPLCFRDSQGGHARPAPCPAPCDPQQLQASLPAGRAALVGSCASVQPLPPEPACSRLPPLTLPAPSPT